MAIFLLQKKDFKALYFLFLGIAIPTVLLTLYLLFHNILNMAIEQIILLNLSSYPNENFLDVVLSSFGGTLKRTWPFWIMAFWSLVKNKTRLYFYAFAFFVIPLLFLLNRPYQHYWIQLLPFVAIGSAILLTELKNQKKLLPHAIAISIIIATSLINGIWSMQIYKKIDKPKYDDQVKIATKIRKNTDSALYTENQFIAYYYLASKLPVSKYLYLGEINKSYNAEEEVTQKINSYGKIIIAWPTVEDLAYAQKIEKNIKQTMSLEFSNEYLSIYISAK